MSPEMTEISFLPSSADDGTLRGSSPGGVFNSLSRGSRKNEAAGQNTFHRRPLLVFTLKITRPAAFVKLAKPASLFLDLRAGQISGDFTIEKHLPV